MFPVLVTPAPIYTTIASGPPHQKGEEVPGGGRTGKIHRTDHRRHSPRYHDSHPRRRPKGHRERIALSHARSPREDVEECPKEKGNGFFRITTVECKRRGQIAMVPGYHFDTLAIHPPPKHLESSSSYITRLAQANEIRSINGLLSLLSLEFLNKADLPFVSFGALSSVALCSDARLLGTTFYHLVRKFNRPPLPQPASRFLATSITQRLRYCPKCLIEFGYYSLCWRFSRLTGCIYHSCQLLEKCGHCGNVISLAVWSTKLGICPWCKGDLRSCPTHQLLAVEQRKMSECHQELEFLLMPHPCDLAGDKVIQFVGQQLADLRKARGESRSDIARIIDEPLYSLANVESGDTLGYGPGCFRPFSGFFLKLCRTAVFLPTVLQIRETMVLQGVSLMEKLDHRLLRFLDW